MKSVKDILTKLENADNTVKNEVENMLVECGTSALPQLVAQLQVCHILQAYFQLHF